MKSIVVEFREQSSYGEITQQKADKTAYQETQGCKPDILWYQETNGDFDQTNNNHGKRRYIAPTKNRKNKSVEEYHLQQENAHSDGECRHGNGDIARDDLT